MVFHELEFPYQALFGSQSTHHIESQPVVTTSSTFTIIDVGASGDLKISTPSCSLLVVRPASILNIPHSTSPKPHFALLKPLPTDKPIII